jgi:hypothetical protein
MKNVVPATSFDWDGFLEETQKNLENMITSDMLVIKQVDRQVEYFSSGWKNLDLLRELRGGDTRLFVHFAVDNLDNAVVLADGTTKLYVDPAVVSTEDEDVYDDAVEEAREHIYCSETESVGYIFERQGDDLTISTGWYVEGSSDGPPAIEVLANNEELDFYGYAMERYINQFMLV